MSDFQTPPELFVAMIAIYTVVALFLLGGRQAFFEPAQSAEEDPK